MFSISSMKQSEEGRGKIAGWCVLLKAGFDRISIRKSLNHFYFLTWTFDVSPKRKVVVANQTEKLVPSQQSPDQISVSLKLEHSEDRSHDDQAIWNMNVEIKGTLV